MLTMMDEVHADGIREGFVPEQMWNANVYLAGLVGAMAIHLREHGQAYPSVLDSAEEWHDILTRIGEPLVHYAQRDEVGETTPEDVAEARAAMELFANWFDQFGD